VDAQQFIEKFLKREEDYSDLLISISKMEKQAEEFRKANEELQKKLNRLKEKNIAVEKQKSEQKDDNGVIDEVSLETGILNLLFRHIKNLLLTMRSARFARQNLNNLMHGL